MNEPEKNLAAATAAPVAEEPPSVELGDRVIIIGGTLDGTRGRVYYLDPERLRILPDGVSDRLIEIPIVDGDLDPQLRIENLFIISKRTSPSFVAQIDAQKDYIADTFGMNGEPGITYKITDINEQADTLTLEDETGGKQDIEFIFGIPLDLPFAVLRPRLPPELLAAAEAEAAEEEENAEANAFENVEFTEPAAPAEAAEAPALAPESEEAYAYYPDSVQRVDAFTDFLSELTLQNQKNPKKQKAIRQLVEQCMLMRNELVQYSRTGEPTGQSHTSYQTVVELLSRGDIPLSRPVLDVKRSIYLERDPDGVDPVELPGKKLEIQYLESVLQQSNEFLETQLGGVAEAGAAATAAGDALPAWYLTWETFFKRFFRVWVSSGEGSAADMATFRGDKEFLRAPAPKSGDTDQQEDVDAVGPGATGSASDVSTVAFSLLRGLGPRYTRLRTTDPQRKIETGEEASVTSQLLFPLSTERDLGSTRSGRLAKDIAYSHSPSHTLKDILQHLGGVPEEPTAGGILSIGLGGNTSGSIGIEDWLKGQPLQLFGLGDAVVDLKNLGLIQAELTVDQQEVLIEKVKQIRALIKEHIKKAREESAAALAAARLEPNPFLTEAALEEYLTSVSAEPLLAARAEELRGMLPAYRDNDIALFAGLAADMADLLVAALAGVPASLAIERNRRVRDQFMDALRKALRKAQLRDSAGEEPTPLKCIHVNDLDMIRKVDDDTDRMKLLAKFLARYKRSVEGNWVMCTEGDHRLLCQHEAIQVEEFLRPREKDTIHKELLLSFSGGVFNGKYMCKVCGQPIDSLEFDANMEFDDEGRPMAGRGQLVDRDALAEEEMNLLLGAQVTGPEMNTDDLTDTQKLIYKTAKEIFTQIGIYPEAKDFQRVIERVESEIQKQPSREEYARVLKSRAAAAAAQKTAAPKALDYDVLINRILVSAVAAHVLIEIQTHVPEFVPRYRLPGCRASFAGYPFGAEKDKSGLEYIACAVASIKRNEAPWNLTGFLTETSDKRRQEAIMGSVTKLAADAMKTASVQQLVVEKRAYLERVYGAAVLGERIPEAVPAGFKPVPYAPKAEEAASAPVVPNAAEPSEAARGWIQMAHRLARENGTFIRGSPFSEASCCFAPIARPRAFWTEKGSALPTLGEKKAPPGARGSQVIVHFKPRRQARMLADPPEQLFYRVFLRVCYDGPRKGLPHEPGYTNICAHCGFVFPEDPFVETPAPPLNKDLFKEWKQETDAIIEKGKTALQTQKVVVTRDTFQDLLDASHRAYEVHMPELKRPTVGLQLLAKLQALDPEPFDGWRVIMSETVARVSTLPPGNDAFAVAEAYTPLVNGAVTAFRELQRRLGERGAAVLQGLLKQSPSQVAESLRAYILLPFQRLLNGFRNESLFIQRSYDLPPPTLEAIQRALAGHLEGLNLMRKHVKGYTAIKMEQARRQMVRVIGILQNEIRANLVPGGATGAEYLVQALVLGVLEEFLNPNRIPDVEGATAAMGKLGTVDSTARMPINILDACLSRLEVEGLNLTEEQIRNIVAQREEDELLSFVKQFDRMEPDQKKMALQIKRLGLKEWAVGGTKAIYNLDPELLERERARREEMGIVDFTDDPNTARLAGVFTDADYDAGAEAGYEVAQYGADD